MDRYWVPGGNGNWSSSTNWSTTSGGSSGASVPGQSHTAIFDENSGSGITVNYDRTPSNNRIDRLITTGFTGKIVSTNYGFVVYSELRLSPGLEIDFPKTNSNGRITISGRVLVQTNGAKIKAYDFGGITSEVELLGDLEIEGTIRIQKIVLDKGYTIKGEIIIIKEGDYLDSVLIPTKDYVNILSSPDSGLLKDATIILDGSLGSGVRYQEGIGEDVKKIIIKDSGIASSVTLSPGAGATIETIEFIGSEASTIKIQQNARFNVENFLVSGKSGKLVTIQPVTNSGANRAQMEFTGTGIVDVDYLSLARTDVLPATDTWYAGNNSVDVGNNSGWIFSAPPQPPTVLTKNAIDIALDEATLIGEIISAGDTPPVTKRGFAFGFTSQSLPTGSPVSSGYDSYFEDTGTFSLEEFSHVISSLSDNTTYYFRAFAYTSDGYGWGTEKKFRTLYNYPPQIEEVLPSAVLTGITPNIEIKGNFFQSGGNVQIDGITCDDIVFVDSKTITCTVPVSATQKSVLLKVENPDGKSATSMFSYMELIPPTPQSPEIEASFEVSLIPTEI